MKCFLILFLSSWLFPAALLAVDFASDIRPILEQRCLDCHNSAKRKGGLVLSSRAGALTPADSGSVVFEPADASEIMRRLMSEDEDERMPAKGDRLSAKEIALMSAWVKEGFPYSEDLETEEVHWAYVAPVKAVVPPGESAIDYFVGRALVEREVSASKRAGKARLLRRLSLDLTGLPPTLDEVHAFESGVVDYKAEVDRLLASPRFGEHWARQWLDLARYADSNGFQADQLRDSWAFRDWVIRALNDNMPFDQFTIEQLAGDLLPGATIDQKIATGFHRTVTCNVEAGVHPEANRHDQVFDRVNTTGLVWLGTSLECAQCHNHKYDPFSQKEYYELFAFFNNTPLEVDNKGKGVSYDFTGPFMDLPMSADKEAERSRLRDEMTVVEKEMKQIKRDAVSAQKAWEAKVVAAIAEPVKYKTMAIEEISSTGSEEFVTQKDGSVLATGTVPSTVEYTLKLRSASAGALTALRLDALTDPSLPGKGPGRGDPKRTNFILSEIEVYASATTEKRGKRVKILDAIADFSQTSWEVSKAFDGNRKTGWAIAPEFSKPHWATFIFDQPIPVKTPYLTVVLDQNFGRGRVLGRVRISGTDGNPDLENIPDDVMAVLKKKGTRNKAGKKVIDAYFEKKYPEMLAVKRKHTKLTQAMNAVKPHQTLVMMDQKEARETHLLIRGDYSNKGMPVSTATPAVLHAWDEDLPRTRLGFAQWLMRPENPLTARVTVNRWWGQLFGRGLVATEEDFGTMSDSPSHPELLDWLAVEFVEQGWSMKHLLKLMVMSETYQRDARITPEQLEADPSNYWLARGPRHRMTAEMIRDNALKISGVLSTEMGGPPVYPPQPDGLWRQTGRNEPKYIVEKDERRFRRGVYIIWRRAAPYASFVNFDGTDRSACVPKRSRTNTPLQALTLLNDETYVELAFAFAQRVLREGGDQPLIFAFRTALARTPTSVELSELQAYLDEELARYRAAPETAKILLEGMQAIERDADLDTAELAAWQSVASVLFNLDETINK